MHFKGMLLDIPLGNGSPLEGLTLVLCDTNVWGFLSVHGQGVSPYAYTETFNVASLK
jgi:hypothetical protein